MFIVSSECIIEHENKFLIIMRPQGKFGEGLFAFPGGTFEVPLNHNGNDVLKLSTKREVYEEVGLQLNDELIYVTSSSFVDTKLNKPVVHIIYHCKLQNTAPHVVANAHEVAAWEWLSYEEIARSPKCPPWIKNYMALVVD